MAWTILREAARNNAGQRRVLCRCTCGVEREVLFDNIKRGRTSGCGCAKVKDHHSRCNDGNPSPTYISWQAMRTRCSNPTARITYTTEGAVFGWTHGGTPSPTSYQIWVNGHPARH